MGAAVRAFHDLLIRYSQNELLDRLTDSYRILGMAVQANRDIEEVRAEHLAIVGAIERHEPNEAERLARAAAFVPLGLILGSLTSSMRTAPAVTNAIFFPLIFSSTLLPSLHWGYAAAGAVMLPILVLCAWVFRPHVAEHATDRGWVVADEEPAATSGPADD
jgi:hypothetical protein